MHYDQNVYAEETKQWMESVDLSELPLFSTVEIETYNRCNGVCPFCPVNRFVDTRKHMKMDKALFFKIIDELCELGYHGRLGLFSNNEPFLDDRIEEFAEYARYKLPKASIYLYTNGSVLTIERFERIISNLSYIVIDNYNDESILNESIKPISELCKINNAYSSKTKIVMRKQNEVLFSRGGNAPNKKNVKTLKMSCILPFKQIVIRPSGELSLCNNDALGEFTMGNVNYNSLFDIWYSDTYKNIRNQIMKGRSFCKLCEHCDSLYHPRDY